MFDDICSVSMSPATVTFSGRSSAWGSWSTPAGSTRGSTLTSVRGTLPLRSNKHQTVNNRQRLVNLGVVRIQRANKYMNQRVVNFMFVETKAYGIQILWKASVHKAKAIGADLRDFDFEDIFGCGDIKVLVTFQFL